MLAFKAMTVGQQRASYPAALVEVHDQEAIRRTFPDDLHEALKVLGLEVGDVQ